MDLAGFEFYSVSGLPVVNAPVDVWDAVNGTPAGSPTASTTTDSNGKWAFTGLTGSLKDVRVTLSGRYHWYKGLSTWPGTQVVLAGTVFPTGQTGLVFFRTDLYALYVYNGSFWQPVGDPLAAQVFGR